MKAYWKYSSTHSLTSALDGGEWSASLPGRFTPREFPVSHPQSYFHLTARCINPKVQTASSLPFIKAKLSLFLKTYKDVWKRENILSFILNFDAKWMLVVSFTPPSFTSGERVPSIYWIGCTVGLTPGLDVVLRKSLLGIDLRSSSVYSSYYTNWLII
jgi:hypothetical protein